MGGWEDWWSWDDYGDDWWGGKKGGKKGYREREVFVKPQCSCGCECAIGGKKGGFYGGKKGGYGGYGGKKGGYGYFEEVFVGPVAGEVVAVEWGQNGDIGPTFNDGYGADDTWFGPDGP